MWQTSGLLHCWKTSKHWPVKILIFVQYWLCICLTKKLISKNSDRKWNSQNLNLSHWAISLSWSLMSLSFQSAYSIFIRFLKDRHVLKSCVKWDFCYTACDLLITCLILSGSSARDWRATVQVLLQRWLSGSCLLKKAFVLVHVAQPTRPYGKQWHRWTIQMWGCSRFSSVLSLLQFSQCLAKSSAPHAHSCGFTAVSERHSKFISSCVLKAANHDKWKRGMFIMAQELFGQVVCSCQLTCCTQM